MALSVKFGGFNQRQVRGRNAIGIAYDDGCEIETDCATVAEMKAWLDAKLSADAQFVAMFFARLALERFSSVAQVNAHRGRKITLDLSKDIAGANAIVRVV